ncbi:hypothetical protein B0H14DRAFT_2373587 [Mycena olivaceomarginata]|nr:hypothetical protein B0H14DRAFT_2373587 [Mycena olivaceomarginata]
MSIAGCVYLFLPLYKYSVDIQDAINANVVNGTHFPEQEIVRLFKDTCKAIRAMRTYRAPVGATLPKGGNAGSSYTAAAKKKQEQRQQQHDDDDDECFPQPEGDSEGGYSYDSRW